MRRIVLSAFWFLFLFPNLFDATILHAENSSFEPPREIIDQDWRIHSLLEAGHLEKHYLMFVEFDKNGTAWIASSSGLVKYDGYTWAKYTTIHGLPSSFVRCVLIASNGTMWVGTDKGAGTFDGSSYRSMGSENKLTGQSIRRIREDSSGTVWFCSDSGGLSAFKDGQWARYTTKEGLPNNQVLDFFEDSTGRQFALTARGLAQRDGDRWMHILRDQTGPFESFWSMVETPIHELRVSSNAALYEFKDNQWTRYISQYPYDYKLCVTQDGKVISCGNIGEKSQFFLEWGETDFYPVSAGFKLPIRGISDLRESPDTLRQGKGGLGRLLEGGENADGRH